MSDDDNKDDNNENSKENSNNDDKKKYDWMSMGSLPPTFAHPNPRKREDWGKPDDPIDNLSPLETYLKETYTRDKNFQDKVFGYPLDRETTYNKYSPTVKVFDTDVEAKVTQALKSRGKIHAANYCRDLTGEPLKDCKEYVEFLFQKLVTIGEIK